MPEINGNGHGNGTRASLNGKFALVTGASRGIGLAIALELARRGADVAINYNSSFSEAEEAVQEICAMGRRAILVQGHVGEASDARSVVKRVLEEWGRLDILVNNAAIRRDRSIRTTHDEWHEVMRVNLDGPYYMTTTAIPSMIQHKFGRIINISSYVAETGTFGQADYAACKGGLIAFTKVIALEMAKYNITANCLAPGFAMGRFGSSDDVAKAAGLLAAEADYITGQTINVNGGIYLT